MIYDDFSCRNLVHPHIVGFYGIVSDGEAPLLVSTAIQHKNIRINGSAFNLQCLKKSFAPYHSLTCSLQVLELMEGGSVIAVYNAARDAAGSSAGSWRPPAARALRYAAQLFRALEYLHGRLPALVHRDVKPGNLLVTADLETVKLADFGVSH